MADEPRRPDRDEPDPEPRSSLDAAPLLWGTPPPPPPPPMPGDPEAPEPDRPHGPPSKPRGHNPQQGGYGQSGDSGPPSDQNQFRTYGPPGGHLRQGGYGPQSGHDQYGQVSYGPPTGYGQAAQGEYGPPSGHDWPGQDDYGRPGGHGQPGRGGYGPPRSPGQFGGAGYGPPSGQGQAGQFDPSGYGQPEQAGAFGQRSPGFGGPPAEPPAQPRGIPGRDTPPTNGSGVRTPRLVVAVAIVLAALVTTAFTANWIRTKADALTPVDIPPAVSTPLKTISPEGYLEPKIDGGFMVNTLGDKMPVMPHPPWNNYYDPVTFRGVAVWMTVHKNYDGKSGDWGNMVGFGMFQPKEPYKDLRNAAALVGGRMINQLYRDPNLAPIEGSVKHRDLTVNGHKAHEIIARIPVKKPKLNETFSTLAILVVDRGDRTLAVSYGDFAGSTPQWVTTWREHAAQIEIAE